jgi:hypothetical protein
MVDWMGAREQATSGIFPKLSHSQPCNAASLIAREATAAAAAAAACPSSSKAQGLHPGSKPSASPSALAGGERAERKERRITVDQHQIGHRAGMKRGDGHEGTGDRS